MTESSDYPVHRGGIVLTTEWRFTLICFAYFRIELLRILLFFSNRLLCPSVTILPYPQQQDKHPRGFHSAAITKSFLLAHWYSYSVILQDENQHRRTQLSVQYCTTTTIVVFQLRLAFDGNTSSRRAWTASSGTVTWTRAILEWCAPGSHLNRIYSHTNDVQF